MLALVALSSALGVSTLAAQPAAKTAAGNTRPPGAGFQQALRQHRISPAREPRLSHARLAALARKKIKFVFVIYQENRSFDSYFGTFPGAEGLFASPAPAAGKAGARAAALDCCRELDTDGQPVLIRPFRIGAEQGAADSCDVDHSHVGLVAKMDIESGAARMDGFACAEEQKHMGAGKMATGGCAAAANGDARPTLAAKQFGELAMAYEDCDTIPLLWAYARKFTLYDHIFQLMTGPSTPGNLAIIGAQTGATQWALHPEQGYGDNGGRAAGVPVLNDREPFWGSALDPTPPQNKMPVNPEEGASGAERTQLNLTYATLPLTLRGRDLAKVAGSDFDPQTDLADVQEDVARVSGDRRPAVEFGWYQEGYDREPSDAGKPSADSDDSDPEDAAGLHASYITHHNGPQYFGYIANNPQMRRQLHGLQDFFTALEQRALPAAGGVFYVKGGYKNLMGLRPADPDPEVQKRFLGDDDHPGYSDAQISEAMVAEVVNRIASSGYWARCAIIITWDDSEGDYDHVPPPIRRRGPDGSATSDGPRVPLILLSPYARAGYVAHAPGNHASVVKFIDAVFGLPPLATLPDELRGRALGEKEFGQKNLGPDDALTPDISDLLEGLSPLRLLGRAAPLAASYARIPGSRKIPPTLGCQALGVLPTDRALGIRNAIPADFSARPMSNGRMCR